MDWTQALTAVVEVGVSSTDVTPLLVPGEIVSAVSVGQIYPASDLAVVATHSSQTIHLACTTTGPATYGLVLTVTTSLRSLQVPIALQVVDSTLLPEALGSTAACSQLLGAIEAGSTAMAKVTFMLDGSAYDALLPKGYVTWDLVSSSGAVFSSGNCHTYNLLQDAFGSMVEAHALVTVPTSTPPTDHSQFYILRYTLRSQGYADALTVQSETVQVTSSASVPLGADSVVEMHGDTAQVNLVTTTLNTSVTLSLFAGNAQALPPRTISAPVKCATGWLHTAYVETTALTPRLDPYMLSWKYVQTPPRATRETGHLYVVNPAILSAAEDLQHQVAKARTTLFGLQDMLFDPVTVLTWLRRGRDMFNAAGGMVTDFTMTDATGGIREFWVRYAEVAALRAQALAEGEKAFNYSGSQVSLDVDRSSAYNQLADQLASECEQVVPTLKKNLLIKGLDGGSGNLQQSARDPDAMGVVGVGYNAISPIHPWRRFSLWGS